MTQHVDESQTVVTNGPARAPTVKFEPIEHVNLTDQVYRAVKHRILSQELEGGARLRDEELVAQLGVSRTPVREALMRLAQEGFVEIVPRSGTFVRSFGEDDIRQIWELRVALETLAVRHAARILDATQIKQLRAMYEDAEAGLKLGRTKPALVFDEELHRVILDASGNDRLKEIMRSLNDFVELFRNIGARTPFHRGYTYRHREILQALERRDAAAAARAMSEHIERSRRELHRDFQQRQGLMTHPAAESARQSRPRRRRASPVPPRVLARSRTE